MEEEKIEENQDASLIYSYPLAEGQQDDPLKGKLFVSGKEAANNLNFIRNNNIKAVLTLTSTSNPKYPEEDNIQHIMIDILDNTTYNIEKDFDQAYEFIESNIQKGNVLVHCEKGVSRSPTIAISYIMKKEKRIASIALSIVKNRRNVIDPNGGFMYHLGRYNQTLKQAYSEEYNKHNLTKPTHQHNENCSKLLAHHSLQQPCSENSDQQQFQNCNSHVSETLENHKHV